MKSYPKLLPQRSFTIIVVLTLIFVGLPIQTVSPISAQADVPQGLDNGIALWANLTKGAGGIVLHISKAATSN